jgi:uncharacterized membrane protein YgcG
MNSRSTPAVELTKTQFLLLIPSSLLFDILILFTRPLGLFTYLASILLLILKAPIFFSGLTKLKERGGELTFGGFGLPGMGGGFRGLSGGGRSQGGQGGSQGTTGE